MLNILYQYSKIKFISLQIWTSKRLLLANSLTLFREAKKASESASLSFDETGIYYRKGSSEGKTNVKKHQKWHEACGSASGEQSSCMAGRFGQRRLLGTSGVLNYQGCDMKLGGAGVIIEIDGCQIGKRKFHKGRHVECQWVFDGIQRASRKSFLHIAPIHVLTSEVEDLL